MNKWTKAAEARLAKIRAAEEGAADTQAVANAFAQLPPGQLKKVLTEDIVAILKKYGIDIA